MTPTGIEFERRCFELAGQFIADLRSRGELTPGVGGANLGADPRDSSAIDPGLIGPYSLEQAIGHAIVAADEFSPQRSEDPKASYAATSLSHLLNRIQQAPHKRVLAAFSLVLFSLAGAVGVFNAFGGPSKPAYGQEQTEGNAESLVSAAVSLPDASAAVSLPPAVAPPEPAPPSLADAAPLRAHEIFGFAPYWTLSQSAGFDVSKLTTLAYFSIGVNADGSLDESGAGWNGYESQDLANLVTRAHAAGDRVVLTVNDFDQGSLDQLTSSPTAGATLSSALIGAIQAKNLDGVNLDFEGDGSADQSGLTKLVTQVSTAIHAVNPHYQVTMDTYASSAGDPNGFYNIPALAPAVDGFFVMEYQLNLESGGSATSPLTSTMFSDQTTIDQYASAAPAAKVILGMPYFGIDWPTTNGTLTAQATGPATDVSYAQITASGHPIYWDATTDTAWTSYQVGSQWHETFFEDPTSLYDAAQLASASNLGGMGVWALGMDGNDPSLLPALLGFAPAVKDGDVGPSSTSESAPSPPASSASGVTSTGATPSSPPSTTTGGSTTTTAGSTTTTAGSTTTTGPTTTTTSTTSVPQSFDYTGDWQGQQVTLTPLSSADELPSPSGTAAGQLTDFATNDPSDSCLGSEVYVNVWPVSGFPTEFLVVAQTPGDCVNAEFTFTYP